MLDARNQIPQDQGSRPESSGRGSPPSGAAAGGRFLYQVAVIGGGPAGMMAAGRAAELGAKVILLEKNAVLGRKLLLTGKGRCNLTQAEFETRKLIAEYGKNGDFLFSAFSVFGVNEAIKFFNDRGLATKVERGKRVFPVSDKAADVLKVLKKYLKEGDIEKRFNSAVKGIEKEGAKITKIILENGEIEAKNYILATGGKSYPLTGSNGDGYVWLEMLGHTVVSPKPALVPIKIKEDWVKECQGLSLKNVAITVLQNNKKQDRRFGEALFTHFGLSGPIVLDISKKVGELLKKGKVVLKLDLKPALDFKTLDQRIQRDFSKSSNKLFKNSLDELLPKKLIPVIVRLSAINPDKPINSITREERQHLANLLKGLEMTVGGLLGFDAAIITSGGVFLKEVDNRTMKSKLIDNLFFAGEILDLDGPSGGYNLQVCWTSGYLAGTCAAKTLL